MAENNESKFMKSILKVKTPRNLDDPELSMRRDSAKTINMMDFDESDERKQDFDNLQEIRQKEMQKQTKEKEKNLMKVHLKLNDLINSNEPQKLIEIESKSTKINQLMKVKFFSSDNLKFDNSLKYK